MAASLGEAYINVKASTKGFAADLSKQLKAVLATAQKDADGAFKSIAKSAQASSQATTRSVRAGAKAQVDATRAAHIAIRQEFARTEAAQARLAAQGKIVRDSLGNVFSGISTGAKFATIGVLALGAALIGVGLQSAAALQNTKIAFGALANEIVNGDQAVQKFGVEASKAIGDKFTQDLRTLALNSSLAFTTLASVSQQLLSLGFNGEQTKSVIIDVGNALAASGKTGGQLNEDLRGIFTAFSQIKGAGRLLAQDLNQITTRIPAATRVKVYNQLAIDLGLAAKNAKSASPELTKARKEVIKLAEAGKISADSALLSLDKVFKAVSGAGPDAKGLNALQRANLSLTGQFEQLKETIRNTLADVFDPITEGLAKKLTGASAAVRKTLLENADSLKNFTLGFADTLIALIDPLGRAIGTTFEILAKAVQFIAPIVVDLFQTFEKNFPAIKATIIDLATGLAPVADILISITKTTIELAPVFAGIGDVVAALGLILAPVALLFRGIADAIGAVPTSVLQAIGDFIGVVGLFIGILIGGPAVIAAVVAGVGALAAAIDVLTVSLVLNPIGATIAGLVALGIAFKIAWERSEFFRKVVVTELQAFAAIGAASITVVLGALRALVEAYVAVANAIGKIPGVPNFGADAAERASDSIGHLITSVQNGVGAIGTLGQSADVASTKVANLAQRIVTLPNGHSTITIDVIATGSQAGRPVINGKALSGPGFTDADKKFASDAAAKKATQATDAFLEGLKGGLEKGGSAGKTGGAQAAADNFRKKIQDILDSIDKEFKTSLVTGNAKQIDTALDALRKRINDAFVSAKKPPPSGLLKAIDADNKRLKALATERESVLKKLADATARAKEVSDGVNSFAAITNLGLDDIAKAATRARVALADLSRLRIILPGQDALNSLIGGSAGQAALKANASKFATELDLRLQDIKKFQADIQKLIDSGLNKSTIDQIISGGVEGGGGIAATLAGASAETIKSINTTQAAIEAAGKALGNTAADSLFRSGQSVVDGLIAGLENRRDEIKKAMSTIADDLVSEIRKKLKIKSPSRVTMAIGRFIGKGLEHGLIRSRPAVNKASNALATASIPRYQRVSLNQLASMAAADSSLQRPGAPGAGGSSVTHNREVNAPINQTFHVGPGVDHRALADHVGRGVAGRLR